MKKGDRVTYQGQAGTVMETRHVTPGMVDLQLDHEGFVRRAARAIGLPLAMRTAREHLGIAIESEHRELHGLGLGYNQRRTALL